MRLLKMQNNRMGVQYCDSDRIPAENLQNLQNKQIEDNYNTTYVWYFPGNIWTGCEVTTRDNTKGSRQNAKIR